MVSFKWQKHDNRGCFDLGRITIDTEGTVGEFGPAKNLKQGGVHRRPVASTTIRQRFFHKENSAHDVEAETAKAASNSFHISLKFMNSRDHSLNDL